MPDANSAGHQPGRPEGYQELAKYEKPDVRHAIRQLSNTLLPLLALLVLMLWIVKHGYPYWSILAMEVVAAGLVMRMFIFLHDASHGSFFPSPRANAILGFWIGVLTLTPFGQWRWSHLSHHASFGNLDRRGVGDIDLMTVEEYQTATRMRQLVYRLYRHPLVMFGLGSTLLFAVIYRFPIRGVPPRERMSVWQTDAVVLAVVLAAGLVVGIQPFLLVMTPIWVMTWLGGVWIFYIQHQFQGVYWAREAEWDFFDAALKGSSYYKLPTVLRWITGDIGLHHLHHLRPRIPNYHLQQAYDTTPILQTIKPLTPRSSLASLRLNLYDERHRQMVSFHDLIR